MSDADRMVYTLDDPADSWSGADKEAHGFGAALVVVTVVLWGLELWQAPLVAFGIGVLVEGIEVYRWRRLGLLGRLAVLMGTRPWPWLCDRFSFKDVTANLGGCALGVLLCVVF